MTKLSVSLSREVEALVFEIAQREGIRPTAVIKRAFDLLKIHDEAEWKGGKRRIIEEVTSDA